MIEVTEKERLLSEYFELKIETMMKNEEEVRKKLRLRAEESVITPKNIKFKVGDMVVAKKHVKAIPGERNKFENRWSGPFRIKELIDSTAFLETNNGRNKGV